jgi:hypothetical protein
MSNQLLNDRNRLMRYGDRDSEANQKIRKAAFNVIFAICKAFLPGHPTDSFRILICGQCRIKIRYMCEPATSLLVEVEMYELFSRDAHHEDICYWHIDAGGEWKNVPQSTSLPAARVIAEHLANGWLPKVLEELKERRGREAALKLSQELGLPLVGA